MATIADLLSVPTVLEHDGKQYELRPPNLLEQGRFQRWLEVRAREAVERGAYASEDARDKDSKAVVRDIAAGVYEWGGEVCVAALQNRAGVQKLIELICGVPEKEAASLVDGQLRKCVELIRSAQADDPKALRRALASLGLPGDFLTPKGTSSSASARAKASRRKKSRR